MTGRVDYGYETWSEKFKRKFNENPWVPLGCLATAGALTMSAIKMKAGKSRDMNYWLRARVVLQGLTIVALVSGAMALQNQRARELTNPGVANNLPRNEATTELIREQKMGKERAKFEDRLRAAEIAHREEQAANAQALRDMNGHEGAPSTKQPYAVQKAIDTDASEGPRSGSSWTRWFRWGSSKGGQDESSKK